MEINVAYVISLVHKANIFEWAAHELDSRKFRQVYILMHSEETEFELNLKKKGFVVYRINYENKRNMLKSVFSILRILRKEKIGIVHTHLFDAGVAGMLAAWLRRIPRRIHTRHDATVNLNYYPKAVKWDKFTSRLATDVIAISESVKDILVQSEGVPEKKITVIHHGFRLEEFNKQDEPADNVFSKKYFPSGKPFPVIGIISRYIHWKGIEYAIEAFGELRKQFPDAHLLLANASGPYKKEIGKYLDKLPEDSFTEIVFESEIFSLYRLFDIFVHVPIDEKAEAFGQIYIESMASGVPSVVTLSGIAHFYIKDKENSMVVPYKNSNAIHSALTELLHNDALRKKLIANGRADVMKNFTVSRYIKQLGALYLKK
jgi:glycosyltransferase involved in cell wall biosynthesis